MIMKFALAFAHGTTTLTTIIILLNLSTWIITLADAQPVDAAAAPISAELKAKVQTLVRDCKQKTGASDTDLTALKMHQLPTTKEGLCLIECVFNSAKIMKDGQFDREGALQVLTPFMQGNATKVEQLKGLSDACDKEMGDKVVNGCDRAKTLVECLVRLGPAYGFQFPKNN